MHKPLSWTEKCKGYALTRRCCLSCCGHAKIGLCCDIEAQNIGIIGKSLETQNLRSKCMGPRLLGQGYSIFQLLTPYMGTGSVSANMGTGSVSASLHLPDAGPGPGTFRDVGSQSPALQPSCPGHLQHASCYIAVIM